MDRLLHLVAFLVILPFTLQENPENGACECAVFPVKQSESIIERTLQFNVTCDEHGEKECQALCIALAESARDKAPQMICEKLNTHVEDLQVAVYARTCNETTWKFTGLKSADRFCCHEGKTTPCKGSALAIED